MNKKDMINTVLWFLCIKHCYNAVFWKCIAICYSKVVLTNIKCIFWFYRIVRAFLIEEQKIVVRVLKAQEASKK